MKYSLKQKVLWAVLLGLAVVIYIVINSDNPRKIAIDAVAFLIFAIGYGFFGSRYFKESRTRQLMHRFLQIPFVPAIIGILFIWSLAFLSLSLLPEGVVLWPTYAIAWSFSAVFVYYGIRDWLKGR